MARRSVSSLRGVLVMDGHVTWAEWWEAKCLMRRG